MLRAGDTVRSRHLLMDRDKLAALRAVAQQRGWLDAVTELPADDVGAPGTC